MLKDKYKEMRKLMAKSAGDSAYRYTVRQLESLVRLSEAMARLHVDEKIRPSYVQEVCRLLRMSNINVVKDDIELEANQDAMNEDRILRNPEQDKQF